MTLDAIVALLTWFRRHLSRIRGNEAGNTAIMLGLCLLPTIGLVGLGIDYWSGLSNKARLDAAADGAALAAINAAQAYYNANVQTQPDPAALRNGAKAAGEAQGYKTFPVNAGAAVTRTSATPTVTVTPSGQTFTAKVTYTAKMPTAFGKMFGTTNLNVGGSSTSTLTMGKYIDFYLLLDVSGSMGLPTTSQGQATMTAYSKEDPQQHPEGCAFACHFNGDSQSYAIARQHTVQLRIDSVAVAVKGLLDTAVNTQTLKDQYRVGIYPFINHAVEASMIAKSPFSQAYAQVTSNASSATIPTTFADTWLDQGNGSSAIGSGGTHFENILGDLYNKYMLNQQPIGDGSSPHSPKVFVFIVTDGAEDNRAYSGTAPNGSFVTANPQQPNNWGTYNGTPYCAAAASAGITISILYLPYVPIANPSAGFGNQDGNVNAVIPYIPGDLQACAAPNFFFSASSPTAINQSLQAMFFQALQAARLTQ